MSPERLTKRGFGYKRGLGVEKGVWDAGVYGETFGW
jgi:hypothetical protein